MMMRYYEWLGNRWHEALSSKRIVTVLMELLKKPAVSIHELSRRTNIPVQTLRALLGMSKRHRFMMIHLISIIAPDGAREQFIIGLSDAGREIARYIARHGKAPSRQRLIVMAIKHALKPLTRKGEAYMCAQGVKNESVEKWEKPTKERKIPPKPVRGVGHTYSSTTNSSSTFGSSKEHNTTYERSSTFGSPNGQCKMLFRVLSEIMKRRPTKEEFGTCLRIYKSLMKRGLPPAVILKELKDRAVTRWQYADNPVALMKITARMLIDALPVLKWMDEQAKRGHREAATVCNNKEVAEKCEVCGIEGAVKTYMMPRSTGDIAADSEIARKLSGMQGKRMCIKCYETAKKNEAKVVLEAMKVRAKCH